MELPRDLRVGWDKMISREMQLEMWKIENQGVRKSLDELAQRYSAPGDEWRRHLPALPLSLDRSSQTDASELQPVAEMDDERRHLRKELEKLRSESEDALRRQKLFYEDQLSKVGPELRAQAQKQVRALELEMEERLRAVRAACRVQLRNEVARATAQLRRAAGPASLTEAEVQVDAAEEEVEQRTSLLSSPSAGQPQPLPQPLPAESREWWTQEREQLLHEAACRLQRQTTTLRRMAARIDQLEDQLAVARIKEESTKLEARRRGGALLTSAEAELRLEAVRRHAQRLEAALEARRKEAEEAHTEAAELRRQLALVQGCAALRGHWLGAAGSLSSREEPSTEEDQVHGREAAPQRLTSWSRMAAKEAPPTQQADQGELPQDRARSPPPRSAGSADSLECEMMAADDRRRRLEEGEELQQPWTGDVRKSPSPRHGAAEESFYLENAQNQEVWGHPKERDLTAEANASGGVTHSAHATRDIGSVDRAQRPPVTDDDDDVITENRTNTETVGNSPGTFSESKSQSWHSSHRNQDSTGRFRRIDTLRSPRSQVVHHVVDIEPDFSADYRRRAPRRRSRFVGGLERIRGEEIGYPIKYSVPSQQISSFIYSAEIENQAWPSSYTERNLDSAEIVQDAADWGIDDVKRSVFDNVGDPSAQNTPRSPRSVDTRARMVRPRVAKTKKTLSQPSDAFKVSSDTSSVESPDQEPAVGSYYDRMVQRMGGDVAASGGQRPEGETAHPWSLSPLHGEEGHGVRKSAWRRIRGKAKVTLSQQSASELEEIDRRRQQRQIQHLEAMAIRE